MSDRMRCMAKVYNEAALEEALVNLYQQWGALGFWAKRFHQKFSPGRKQYIGGVAAVRKVLVGRRTGGFDFLREHDSLDLSVERLILKPEWKDLFCEEDRALARGRLSERSQ